MPVLHIRDVLRSSLNNEAGTHIRDGVSSIPLRYITVLHRCEVFVVVSFGNFSLPRSIYLYSLHRYSTTLPVPVPVLFYSVPVQCL